MLSQKEAVIEVLSVYELIEDLKRVNDDMSKRMVCTSEEKKDRESNQLTEKLARYGREMLANKFSYTWNDITACRSEGEGIWFNPNSFEKWAAKKLKHCKIPSYMNREEVMDALREELFDLYQKEKEEARKFLLEQEAKAKEEAE